MSERELNLNEDPDVRETGGLPRVDDEGGHGDDEDRLADALGGASDEAAAEAGEGGRRE